MIRNIKEEDLQEVIKKCDFKPKRYSVLVTINRFEPVGNFEVQDEEENTDMDEWQYIINTGNEVEYKPGDKVLLDLPKLLVQVPDPENKGQYEEKLAIYPIPVGDNIFTVVPDNVILGKKIEYPEVELDA